MSPLLLLAALSHLPPREAAVCSTGEEPHVLSLVEWRSRVAIAQTYRAASQTGRRTREPRPDHDEVLAAAYAANAYGSTDALLTMDWVRARAGEPDCDSACRADVVAVLAVIYLREGEDLVLNESKAAEADCSRCLARPDCVGSSANHDESRRWLERAVDQAQAALELAPTGPQADLAIATLGRAQFYLGRAGEARQTLLQLRKKWPDSATMPEALLILGELHDSADVLASYFWLQAGDVAGPDRFFALYRLAWAQDLYGEPSFAIAAAERAARALSRMELDGAARAPLDDELDRSLLWFYADSGQSEAIVRALKGTAPTGDPLAARLSGRTLGPRARAGMEDAIALELERGYGTLAGQLRTALDRAQPAR